MFPAGMTQEIQYGDARYNRSHVLLPAVGRKSQKVRKMLRRGSKNAPAPAERDPQGAGHDGSFRDRWSEREGFYDAWFGTQQIPAVSDLGNTLWVHPNQKEHRIRSG